MIKQIPNEYYVWFISQTFQHLNFTTADVQKAVNDELTRFASMSTEEYILWQKWEEVQITYPMEHSILVDEYAYKNANDGRIIQQIKSKLWNGDYKTIEPELIRIGDEKNASIKDHWTALRILIHSQQHSGSIGRALNYLVRDRTTQAYLGVISVASDFLDMAARDDKIGWTREQRTQEQKIQHTAVCSTVVPVQPFGFNYLGGKLLALLCLSEQVQRDWKSVYGSTLVGLSTTSLYGKTKGVSQYDNLKFWNNMGYSSGSSALRTSKEVRNMMYEWAKIYHPLDYYMFMVHKDKDGGHVRDRQNRFIQTIYRKLKISPKLYTSNHDRGVYFARLYKNTDDFLRGEILEKELVTATTPVWDFTVAGLTQNWKEKYASRRIDQLYTSKRVKTEPLFYDDLATLSWDDAKARYLGDVGR